MFFKIVLSLTLVGKFVIVFILLIISIVLSQAYISKFIEFPLISIGEVILFQNCKKDEITKQEAEKRLTEFNEAEKLFRTQFGDETADKQLKEGLQSKKELEQSLKNETECENHTFLIYFFISLIPLFGLSFWIWKDIQFLKNKT